MISISNGAPLAPIEAHLIAVFFGCCCVLNRIDVGRGSMMLTNVGIGWGDRQVCLDYFIDGLDYSYFAAFF